MKIEMLVLLVVVGLLGMTRLADDPVQAELDRLAGTYRLVTAEEAGKPVDAGGAKLTFRGREHQMVLGDQTLHGRHRLQSHGKQPAIDFTDTAGPFAGQTRHGIYRLEQGQLTICLAPPGAPRPRDFDTQDDPGLRRQVWKRMP